MITDVVIVIASFAIGFWCGKTFLTKEALRDAVKTKLKDL